MSESIFRVKTTNENLAAHMRHLASGEGNDGFEYDLLVQGADRIEQLQEQVAERDALIRDGITHLCSYCMDNKERSWEEMQQHIYICEKHPLSKLQQQVDRTCKWKRQKLGTDWDEYDSWGTSCGEDFAIVEEWHDRITPYCSNCGGKVIEEQKP